MSTINEPGISEVEEESLADFATRVLDYISETGSALEMLSPFGVPDRIASEGIVIVERLLRIEGKRLANDPELALLLSAAVASLQSESEDEAMSAAIIGISARIEAKNAAG